MMPCVLSMCAALILCMCTPKAQCCMHVHTLEPGPGSNLTSLAGYSHAVWIDPSCSTNGLSHDHDTLLFLVLALVQ